MTVSALGGRSLAINSEGQTKVKTESATFTQPNISTPMVAGSFAFPSLQLAVDFVNPYFSLSYISLVEIDGRSLYDIHVQCQLPGQRDPNGSIAQYDQADLFIDGATFQVLMISGLPSGVAWDCRLPAELTRSHGVIISSPEYTYWTLESPL